MLAELIKNNLESIREIARRHHVQRLYAFGSVCTERFNEKSDVDLLISFKKGKVSIEDYADNYFSLAEELERLLKREVELVEEQTLANPFFIKTVQRTKQPILE